MPSGSWQNGHAMRRRISWVWHISTIRNLPGRSGICRATSSQKQGICLRSAVHN
ncbi:unnamed protein product [Symbiodinium pilosum]|uniref:Uncharacterized protein n=1 Tax=Symbiodinium pilosum TaxID=2952 RepID=A0A812NHK9_SYMPI|nr:unnamed protein product [Symbiodinium pilosum]